MHEAKAGPIPKPAELDESERQTAIGLARYAFDYISAAILIDENHRAAKGHEFLSPVPAYFLALHGIELTLKAYLRHWGLSPADLRSKKYGHALKACWRKAKAWPEGRLPHACRRHASHADALGSE